MLTIEETKMHPTAGTLPSDDTLQADLRNQRITVDRLKQGQDELGQPLTTWTPLFTAWAAVEPLAGREWFYAGSGQSEATTRIRLRYRPGLTAADRVTHDGRAHSIVSVIDYKSGNRELVLMCRG